MSARIFCRLLTPELPLFVGAIAALGLLGAIILPEAAGRIAVWFFLLPFVLVVIIFSLALLSGLIGRLFR